MEELNKEQILVLNLCLGDGHLKKDYTISFVHSPKQLDYLNYKKELLEKTESFKRATGKKTIGIKSYITNFEGKSFLQYRYSLTKVSIVKPVYNLLVKNGKKTISENIIKYFNLQTLVFLMFDDGGEVRVKKRRYSIKRNIEYIYNEPPSYRLNTHSFSREENVLIIQWLKDMFQIEGKLYLNKERFIIRFNSKESLKIWNLIKSEVSKIDSMKIKFSWSIQKYGLQ